MNQEESRQKQYPGKYPYQEDEIELIDYLFVIWKWKWLIIGGTLICAIVAGIISLQMSRVYRVTMIIKPVVIGLDNVGNYMYNSEEIRAKINEGMYDLKAIFKADIEKYTNSIRVNSEWQEKDIDLGLKASKQLIALITDNYETQGMKNNIDNHLALNFNNIKREIKLQQTTLETTRQRIAEVHLEIKEAKKNTEEIVKQRDAFLKATEPGDNRIAPLLYSTVIQQNEDYLTELRNKIYTLRQEVLNKEVKIEELKSLEKEITCNIKVVQNPEVSSMPVKSKKKQVILLATVAGLFFFIFLAFFIEYIRKASKSIRAGD